MRVKRHFKTTCRRPPSQNVSAQQEGNVFGPLDPNDQIQVSSLKALPSFARLRLQQEDGGRRGGAERVVQLRLPVFLLATRVAEGRGVLDVMAVSTLPSKMRPK